MYPLGMFPSHMHTLLKQVNTNEVVKETSGLDSSATLESTAETGERAAPALVTGLKWLEVGANPPDSVMSVRSYANNQKRSLSF